MFMERQTWPPTSVLNFRSIYPMLRQKAAPRASLIHIALWISWRERLMVSLRMSRFSSRWNSASTRSSLKLGGSQLKFMRCGNHRTAWMIFRISSDISWEQSIRVDSANGLWWQFHYQYFCMAIYHQCGSGISIYQKKQLHWTDAQEQWLVYRSWLYGGDTVSSCHSRLV